MQTNYLTVTEIAGDEVTQEQIDRLYNRYYWTRRYCEGKDIVEIACGTGPGLGYLSSIAKSFDAGDFSDEILSIARRHYRNRIQLSRFDAQHLPYKTRSKDVIILFEAVYYLPDANAFINECARVLRPEGVVLISTANKDLYDFNPSPYTHRYYGIVELGRLLSENGFTAEFFGDSPLNKISTMERVLRPAKKAAVALGLIPKTMSGKKFFKRIVFGKLVTMPNELPLDLTSHNVFPRLSSNIPDTNHKIIFCAATLQKSY